MILWTGGGDIEFREETMLEMERAGNLEDAWNGGELSKSGAEHQGGADVMSVNDVRLNLGDQVFAGAKQRGNLPGTPGGKIESERDDGGAGVFIFRSEASRGGGENYDHVETEGAEDAHLLVDPAGADGGLDDVQNLHEKPGSNSGADDAGKQYSEIA
jgi:hypothetical protein